YLSAVLALLAARRHDVPFFYWLAYPHPEASLHAARTGTARYRFFYYLRGVVQRFLLYRVIMPGATHVFVQSEQMRRDVAREGIPLEKMTAVPSSVELAKIDAVTPPADVEKPAGERWLMYVGTLIRDRKSTRLNSSHVKISYAGLCLK